MPKVPLYLRENGENPTKRKTMIEKASADLAAIREEQSALERENAAWQAKRDALTARLSAVEESIRLADSDVEAATAAAVSAFAEGDHAEAERARAVLSKATAKRNSREGERLEADALRAALKAHDEQAGREIARRSQQLAERERELFGRRLDELAGEVSRQQADALRALAMAQAKASALGRLHERVNGIHAYAPMAVPASVSALGVGSNREQVVEVIADRVPAIQSSIVEQLRAEGWRAI